MKGVVYDIDRFAAHDGPGIRTAVYLKGCPFRCPWCHSPDSRSFAPEPLCVPERCTLCGLCATVCPNAAITVAGGSRAVARSSCAGCGLCADACPNGAIAMSGRVMEASEVVEEACQDEVFFRNTGGGVTLTGGEALAQPGFAAVILEGVKARGVRTIVETSGGLGWEVYQRVAPHVDAFYIDVKHTHPARLKELTGLSLDLVLANIDRLCRGGKRVVFRVPLIPGENDGDAEVTRVYELAGKLGVEEVHLLPYNEHAQAKYRLMGLEYPMEGTKAQPAARLSELAALAPRQLKVKVV